MTGATGRCPSYALAIGTVFAAVYAASLRFRYVEGDDALSVAYHALGRDPAIQQPYSFYQGMADVVLGFLPAREAVVRVVAIGLCSFAAIALFVLLCALVFDWLEAAGAAPAGRAWRPALALGLLLGAPEFLYLGLYYCPSAIAMALVLGAHLLLRKAAAGPAPPGWRQAGVAAALFGLGVSCRWDIGAYLVVVLADLGLGKPRLAWRSILAWSGAAAALSLLFVAASNGGPGIFLRAASFGQAFVAGEHFTPARLPMLATILSPAIGLLAVVGVARGWRERNPLPVLLLAGLVAVVPWLGTAVPKFLLPAMPGLLACAALGAVTMWPARWSRYAILAFVALPWLIGVRITLPSSSWGPGFEIAPFDAVRPRSLSVGAGGGFAIPTREGPRPAGGHAYVLLGGGWRRLIGDLEDERREVIRTALETGAPIVQDQAGAYLVAHLAGLGFRTQDPDAAREGDSPLMRRRFAAEDGRRVDLLIFRAGPSAEGFRRIPEGGHVILYFTFSSRLRALAAAVPGALRPLGPFSAVASADRLRAAGAGASANTF